MSVSDICRQVNVENVEASILKLSLGQSLWSGRLVRWTFLHLVYAHPWLTTTIVFKLCIIHPPPAFGHGISILLVKNKTRNDLNDA